MALTPAPGYKIDPNNPNAVIPEVQGASSPVGMNLPGMVPATQQTIPTPQVMTPPAPAVAPATTPMQQQTAPVATGTPQQTGANAQQMAATGQLTMPANGSVVDLLNMAGVDSSQANRKLLAQQYGVANYDFSGAKNQELAQKFIDAFNAKKGSAVPQTGADARTAMDQFFTENPTEKKENPEQMFFDAYAGMNPVLKGLYDTLNQAISAPATRTSFVDEYNRLITEAGIPGLQTELMDLNRIIDGTEDDIRMEVEKSGGFATDSQVQALAAARNKTLLKRSAAISDQLAMKRDYVDQIVQLTGADREQVDRDVDRKLGLTTTLIDLHRQMESAAKENYQRVIDNVGYQGLSQMLGDNPNALKTAELALGLPRGAISKMASMGSTQSIFNKDAPSIVNEYQFALSQGYKGSFTQYQNEDANRKRSVTNVNVGGLTPSQVINAASGLRDDVRVDPDVKDFVAIRDGYQRINTGASMNSGPGDLAIIFGYMKMLDPTSVVREQEFDNAEKAVGLVQQYQNIPDKFVKGTRLTEEGRQFFVDAARQLYAAKKSNYDSAIASYTSIANQYGIDPSLVVRDFSASTPAFLTKGAMSDGEFVAQALTKGGYKYTDVISSAPAGEIMVARNSDGLIVSMPPSAFNASLYTKL